MGAEKEQWQELVSFLPQFWQFYDKVGGFKIFLIEEGRCELNQLIFQGNI